MDNTRQDFPSAAAALNSGARKAKGEYLLFVHQDVELPDVDWLRRTENIIAGISDVGIAGPIGIKLHCFYPDVVGQIKHTTYLRGKIVQRPMLAHTLDEVLFIIPRKVYEILKFDEETFPNCWHCYGADYCLSVRKLGLKAYVIPAYIVHNSNWAAKPWHDDVHRCARLLANKHADDYNLIWTNSAGGIGIGVIGVLKKNLGKSTCYARDMLGIEAPTVYFGMGSRAKRGAAIVREKGRPS